MRPSQFRHRATRPAFFVSPKCEIAIPIHQSLLRSALQQAALEPGGPGPPLSDRSLHRVSARPAARRRGRSRGRPLPPPGIRNPTRAQRGGTRSCHICAGTPRLAAARTRWTGHPARAALQQRARGVVVCPIRCFAHRQAADRACARRCGAAVARRARRTRSYHARRTRRGLLPRVRRPGQPQHRSHSVGAAHNRARAIA
jgi:hypothetical protein